MSSEEEILHNHILFFLIEAEAMRPKQQAQGQFLIFQNENQFHFQAKLPEKTSWCFPANEWGCLRSRWRFCSCLRFADDSFPGGSRTCQDGTSPFSVWPLLSEGKVWRLPACLSTVRVFALTHTLLITFQMGVWGVNMTVQIDDTIAALWLSKCSLPSPPPDWELCHIQCNLATRNFLAEAWIYAILVPVYVANLDPLTRWWHDSVCTWWLNA